MATAPVVFLIHAQIAEHPPQFFTAYPTGIKGK
jgi:hypothetical protein